MSPLLYLFLGLAFSFTFCLGASITLNRKAILTIFQLQKDIKTSEAELEQKLLDNVQVDQSELEEGILEIEKRFKKVESMHNYSRLFLYSAFGLTLASVVTLIVYAVVGD